MTRSRRDLDARLAAAEERVRRLEQRLTGLEDAAGRRAADDWHLTSGSQSTGKLRRRRRGILLPIVAIVVLFWALGALPAALADVTPSPTPDMATAEPAPTATDTSTPVATDTSTPSPTDTSTPSPTDTGTPPPTDTGTPTPTHTPMPTSTPTSPGTTTPGPTFSGEPGPDPTLVLPAPTGPGSRHHRSERKRWKDWRPKMNGEWTTKILDRAAARARQRGWSVERIAHEIYAPFPVMGPASWSDSWGAPRYVGGYHPHAGQDVLCRWGAPVLAIEDATVTYGENRLGGTVAYLSRDDGSFWYYAHLSSTRARLAGQAVHQGDIIGRCGATGDASVPHVHFGFEDADGTMLDTLHALRVTLGIAEAGLFRPDPVREAPVPTPDPSTALPVPWPRKPVEPQQPPASSLAATTAEMSVAAGVLVAIGVLGPLTFLYRRTRRIAPVSAN